MCSSVCPPSSMLASELPWRMCTNLDTVSIFFFAGLIEDYSCTLNTQCTVRELDCPHKSHCEIWWCKMAATRSRAATILNIVNYIDNMKFLVRKCIVVAEQCFLYCK